MVSDKKLANAMSGKTARACDSCIRKRARWFCAADDAFLCQACDASVHSANSLARRHERVRLKTSSFKSSEAASLENPLPSWHHGFTRKARTTRHGKHTKSKPEEPIPNGPNPLLLVPEMGSDHEENNEEQLLYRVPIFDPFAAELCTSVNSNEAEITGGNDIPSFENKSKAVLLDYESHDVNCLHEFLPSEMDLAEFAADVESLLGKGLDEESFDMEGLGLSDCKEKDFVECSLGSGKVKVEDEEVEVFMGKQVDMEIDMTRKQFELNFDYDFTATCEEDDKVISGEVMGKNIEECKLEDVKKKILLRLDYEGIITAWADQRSPWTTGERPELDPTDCWPDCMGNCGTIHYQYGDMATMGGHTSMVDGGREARVSRYREKRRTRLFSKKIRYEVRKLNAEKRPRMKGRFVKRSNFLGPTFPLLNK